MKTTKVCEHDVRVQGDHKVCAVCKLALGPVYNLDRLNEDIQFLLGRISLEYDTLKAKFMADASKDPSSAIRWLAYDLLVSQHRAAYAEELQRAFGGAKTSTAMRDLLRDERTRLTRHLTRGSAAEWDTSTCAFNNQDMKARTVADAKSLKLLADLADRFDVLDADLNLPRMAQP